MQVLSGQMLYWLLTFFNKNNKIEVCGLCLTIASWTFVPNGVKLVIIITNSWVGLIKWYSLKNVSVLFAAPPAPIDKDAQFEKCSAREYNFKPLLGSRKNNANLKLLS